MTLSDLQIASFKKAGYISPIRIADQTQADCCRDQFNQLEAREGREKSMIGLLDRHMDHPFIWELATQPDILDCIEAVIGPNILLLATHFFCKYGGSSDRFVAWHQDVTYWGLEPPMAVTAWYAVDDSDRDNGCMQIIPGTHAAGIREHGKSAQDGNLLSINQEVNMSPEQEKTAVDLILKPGEMSIHHGLTIHGSLPNQSDRRRCGLTMRYVPTFVKQVNANSMGIRYHALLVRGQDEEKHFGEMDPPSFK